MNSCPSCLSTLPAAQSWVCTSPGCGSGPGTLVRSGPVTVTDGTNGARGNQAGSIVCEHCRGAMVEVCPVEWCRFVVPRHWRETAATTVVMAGARGAGKSIYIGVLVKQLELYGEAAGLRISAATAETSACYREYFEGPLYRQRGMLASNPSMATQNAPQAEPLVFEIAPRTGSVHYLVIRDVAGEDLGQNPPPRDVLRFFGAADGIILLFDPLGVPDVRRQLDGIVPAQRVPSGDPWAVLDNVVGSLGGRSPKLAVAVSKFDTMHAVRAVRGVELGRMMQNSGAAFSREPDRREPYDEADGQLLHEEIRSLLQWLGAAALVNAMERLTVQRSIEHRFFAVSALGDAPDGEHLHDRGIAPFRALDPMRWILAERSFA